jgi:hypothetical protein
LPEALVGKLRSCGEDVVDLTVRNLAMSAAMVVHHRQQSDELQAGGSERVNLRCTELLRQLEPNTVKVRLERLLEATAQNKGDDVSFLERWKYDKHQKEAITFAIHAVAEA